MKHLKKYEGFGIDYPYVIEAMIGYGINCSMKDMKEFEQSSYYVYTLDSDEYLENFYQYMQSSVSSLHESNSEDIDFIMAKIKENFTIDKVSKMLKNESLEWSDDYETSNNGEAEDMIVESLISWYEKNYNKIINIDLVSENIKEYYKL